MILYFLIPKPFRRLPDGPVFLILTLFSFFILIWLFVWGPEVLYCGIHNFGDFL
ncbi:hypothetical protein BDZ91DRAFT_723969, partial [Kalaharituber pfeilii]